MKQFIPNRELDELGTGVVLTYLKKSGTAGLPRCVDIEGIANSMGLNVVYETFAEDDFDNRISVRRNYAFEDKKRKQECSISFPFGNNRCGG